MAEVSDYLHDAVAVMRPVGDPKLEAVVRDLGSMTYCAATELTIATSILHSLSRTPHFCEEVRTAFRRARDLFDAAKELARTGHKPRPLTCEEQNRRTRASGTRVGDE